MAIAQEVGEMREQFARRGAADAPKRPARLRHFITNVVLDIKGDRATGCAYWFELTNDTRDRWPYVGGYGHYEDEMRKADGRWLFVRRKIYNEVMDGRTAHPAIRPDKTGT